MSYKVVLVYVDGSDGSEASITIAASIAAVHQARLSALVVSKLQEMLVHAPTRLTSGDTGITPYTAHAREHCAQSFAQLDRITQQFKLAGVQKIWIDGDVHDVLCDKAKFSDLLVLGLKSDKSSQGDRVDPARIVTHCGVPVIFVPPSGGPIGKLDKVLIGWDASVGATRALHSAIPLLKHATTVHVATIVPGKPLQEGEEAQLVGPVADFLNEHGIPAQAIVRNAEDSIGRTLLSLAAQMQADLLVMGSYGNSPGYEMLFGGVTRSVLKEATLPVLMAY